LRSHFRLPNCTMVHGIHGRVNGDRARIVHFDKARDLERGEFRR
jgi:hypothetical protein